MDDLRVLLADMEKRKVVYEENGVLKLFNYYGLCGLFDTESCLFNSAL